MVKEGEAVTPRYRVTKFSADMVEFIDLSITARCVRSLEIAPPFAESSSRASARPMFVAIIVNPLAGGATPARAGDGPNARQLCYRTSAKRAMSSSPIRRGHARELARRRCARGARLVIAWGGDGTVNEVASALASATSLGIVPAGSGNGLARELGVDARPGAGDRRRAGRHAAGDRRRRDRRAPVRQHRRHRLRCPRRARSIAATGRRGSRLRALTVRELLTYGRATTGSDGQAESTRALLVRSPTPRSLATARGLRPARGRRRPAGSRRVRGDVALATICQHAALFIGRLRPRARRARSGRSSEVDDRKRRADDVSRRRRAGGGGTRLDGAHPSGRCGCRAQRSRLSRSSDRCDLQSPEPDAVSASRQPDDPGVADGGTLRDRVDRGVERRAASLASSSTLTTPTAPVSLRPSAKFAMFTPWRPRIVPTSPMTPG